MLLYSASCRFNGSPPVKMSYIMEIRNISALKRSAVDLEVAIHDMSEVWEIATVPLNLHTSLAQNVNFTRVVVYIERPTALLTTRGTVSVKRSHHLSHICSGQHCYCITYHPSPTHLSHIMVCERSTHRTQHDLLPRSTTALCC